MNSITKYILKNALRDKIYLGIFLVLIVSLGLSVFLGSASLVEEQANTSVYLAGSYRIIIAIGMILFVCLSIGKAFENKEIEFILSKSISREGIIFSYLIGFFIVNLLISIPSFLVIAIIGKINYSGFFLWAVSIILENLILISFTLLASLILKNSFSAIFASFAFYLISRLMGIFVLAIDIPKNFIDAKNHILATLLKFLSVAFPRLDLYAQTSWIVYGVEKINNIEIVFWQFIIYLPLLIFMSFHDFKKKQF